jgi:hypothetical protein
LKLLRGADEVNGDTEERVLIRGGLEIEREMLLERGDGELYSQEPFL